MADHPLHLRGDFAEAAVVFRDNEQRVVPKSPRATGRGGDPPVAGPMGDGDDAAERIGKGGVAGVVCAPRGGRHVAEPFEEEAVVGRVIPAAGKPG